jgi:hypothetical protein
MMMNKLHMLALTGLMVSGINNASMMGQEQREVLYTLNKLGQDFVNVPMITQNIDMFMGVLEMNIQVNTAKLKTADKKMKDAFWKNATFLTGAWVTSFIMNNVEILVFDNLPSNIRRIVLTKILSGFIRDGISAGVFASKVFAGLNIYDAWKNRSELIEAIALDKEILGKLEEIKESMSFLEENSAE